MHSPALHQSVAYSNSRCAEIAAMAEHELSAFFHAVTRLFGERQGELSAQEWLHELSVMNRLPSSTSEWRSITAQASARLATSVAPSNPTIDFINA